MSAALPTVRLKPCVTCVCFTVSFSDEPSIVHVLEEIADDMYYDRRLRSSPIYSLHFDAARSIVGHPIDLYWPQSSRWAQILYSPYFGRQDRLALFNQYCWELPGMDYYIAMTAPYASAQKTQTNKDGQTSHSFKSLRKRLPRSIYKGICPGASKS